MKPIVEYILRQRRGKSDKARYDRYDRDDYDMDGRRGRGRDRRDYDDYDDDYEIDVRKNKKRRKYEEDYADYDDEDYHKGELSLTSKDYREWKETLENADGTEGPHFTLAKIKDAAEAMGIKFDKFSEKDLCMTANMLYSDLCTAFDVPEERELEKYTKAACKWLCDKDSALKDSAKLAAYYYMIVCGGEM